MAEDNAEAHDDSVELPSNGLHFFLGPLLALLLVALLGGLLRWTYGTHSQHVAPHTDIAGTEDLGLLREVAVAPTAEAADVLRRLLATDGIRATVRSTPDRTAHRVLVFAKDEPDAKVLLSNPD